MSKVYYDATNNKEVIDISSEKTVEDIKIEYGLTNAVQSVEITNPDYAHKVVNGTLESFNFKSQLDTEISNQQTLQQQKEASIKALLNLTDEQFADLKIAMGL